jgi:predicted PhzF superfamily epimerase YddE/YHI9
MKKQPLAFDGASDTIFVSVDIQQAVIPNVSIADAAKLLHCDPGVIMSSLDVDSVGNPKLRAEVASENVLYSLRPDLDGITKRGQANGNSGPNTMLTAPARRD